MTSFPTRPSPCLRAATVAYGKHVAAAAQARFLGDAVHVPDHLRVAGRPTTNIAHSSSTHSSRLAAVPAATIAIRRQTDFRLQASSTSAGSTPASRTSTTLTSPPPTHAATPNPFPPRPPPTRSPTPQPHDNPNPLPPAPPPHPH